MILKVKWMDEIDQLTIMDDSNQFLHMDFIFLQ